MIKVKLKPKIIFILELVMWQSRCSLEGLMLRLKLQYFGHLMRRLDSLEKTLMLGGIGGRRRRGQQRMRWLDGITYLMDMGELRELVMDREAWLLQFMGSRRVGHNWVTELNVTVHFFNIILQFLLYFRKRIVWKFH